jgi:hypothetical protein
MSDINIKITDREGVTHDVVAPTDMSMNLMEIIRSYELAEEGTIGVCGGMAMCASCQVYVISDPGLEQWIWKVLKWKLLLIPRTTYLNYKKLLKISSGVFGFYVKLKLLRSNERCK